MRDNHNIGEPTEPDEADGGAAGLPTRPRRLTIGTRARLLMGVSMGAIAAATVLSADISRTVSHT